MHGEIEKDSLSFYPDTEFEKKWLQDNFGETGRYKRSQYWQGGWHHPYNGDDSDEGVNFDEVVFRVMPVDKKTLKLEDLD